MDTTDRQPLPEQWDAYLPKGTVFRAVFETSQAVMFLLDPVETKLVAANPAACRFYGYGYHELTDLSPSEVSLLSGASLAERLRELREAGATRFATRHRLRDGQLRDMEFDASLVALSDGTRSLLFIGHDITDRRLAEEALQEREGLLQAILDSASDGIGFTDAGGVYREVNPSFCRMAGQSCGKILGTKAAPFFDRRNEQQHVHSERRSTSEHAAASYELALEGPDGTQHLSVHKSPVINANGEFMGMVSVSRDITARRSAEAALRKSESLHRAMLQSAQDSIFVTDENDVLREVNHSFLQHMGRTRAELIDRPLSELFEGPELRLQLSTNALARQTHEPVSFTQRIQPPPPSAPPAPDAQSRPQSAPQDLWLSVVKTAIIDAAGNCLGVVSMGRDITSQRNAEIALRQSERRLSGLIRQAPVGVFETDVSGSLIFANERMQRQTGRDLEGLMGARWLECIAPEDREDFLAAWNDTVAQRREMDREVRLLDGRGARLWTSCRARPMSDAVNRLSGYLGVISDISERKKAESMRADVESVVRHDLKSPLASVQNAMELLPLLGDLNPEQEQVLDEVRSLARRMLGLISLSLDLHAMEAGLFTPALAPVDLCEVAEEQRVELRGLMEGKGLTLELRSDCPEGQAGQGRPFYVRGERRLLDAVFSNLLKNAAEASPEGAAITLSLRREGDAAVVSLRNLGAVPASLRERFFDKYATAGKVRGTGLGTYSARLMVRTMGGALSLNMDEPGATTLVLRLAASPPPAESPLVADPA